MPTFKKINKKIYFFHIPKCGGSSVEAIFTSSGYLMQFHDHGAQKKDSVNELLNCSPQHFDSIQFETIFNREAFDLVFSVVRNPIDRFKSEFAMRNKDMINPTENDIENWFDKQLKTMQNNQYHLDNHMSPQSNFVIDGSIILHLEDGIENGLNKLSDEYELGLTISRTHKLDSSSMKIGSSSNLTISDSLKSKLLNFYQSDFEMFGYGKN